MVMLAFWSYAIIEDEQDALTRLNPSEFCIHYNRLLERLRGGLLENMFISVCTRRTADEPSGLTGCHLRASDISRST
jgi:hypothetical protein